MKNSAKKVVANSTNKKNHWDRMTEASIVEGPAWATEYDVEKASGRTC